ncbi:phage holin family protein, partial [Staphylococcus epidermidis]|uniref:phage holin family protein n=1 Tax=Staphylococcus epidermidis TaxID=1282 RepID=UPI00211E9173
KEVSNKDKTGNLTTIAYKRVVIVARTMAIVNELDVIIVNGSVNVLILSEATSIIENAAILGVPIPDQITKRLNIFSKDNNATK